MSDRVENQQDEEGGLALGDIIAALRRRVWLILLLAALGGVVAVSVALLLTNQYEAVATVQIDPRKKTIVSLDAVLPDIAGDTPTIESQVEILRSRVIALKVIDALQLRSDPEFAATTPLNGALPALGAPSPEAQANRRVLGPEASDIGTDRPERDEVAAAFASRLKTVRIRNSLIVEISFRSRDPVKAARIANTIADVYIRDQIDMKVRATGLAAELLGPKLDGLRAKVAEAEHRVARFKAEHGIFDAEGQLLSEKQLARLMEQTVSARNQTADARAKYERLEIELAGGRGRTTGDVLLSQTVRMLKDQLVKATKHEAELLTKYGPRHPEIARVRAEVSDVEAQIARETDQIIANVKTEYQVAKERERSLDESLEQLKREQNVSKEVTVKLRDLEREAETSRRVLDAFLIRYKQTVETQELALPDSRIVESASVPFAPVSPKRLQISIIGLVLGLGLGVGMALLLELMRKGLGKAEEIEAAMGLPMLGSVPMLKRQSDGLSDPMHALRVVVAHPGGAVARAMRELAENLARRSFDNGARIVLMTASLPNEGTTLTASNLALAMTARGVRTLLIDADLRRSKLTHHMGLAQSRGLVDAIGCGQDFETVILTDTVSGLAIIPAGDVGRYPLAPQEALEAPGFGQRLARLKAHFDLILIDAPPILPVVDTRILASHADQIVLVAVWQRTPKELLRKAVRLLGSNAARLSGIVLNRVDAKVHVAGSVDGRARKEPKRGPGARRAA